ncbi:unnamed protein product [Pedinophyceae sp. YPF-701]|nr:unnamed protein product [Pedinophyceae sp. YPF-701]
MRAVARLLGRSALAAEPFLAAAEPAALFSAGARPQGVSTTVRAFAALVRSSAAFRAPVRSNALNVPFSPATAHPAEQRRGYPCCHGLDKPPPDRIVVRYDPDEVDRYIEIADALEDEFEDIKVEGFEGAKTQFDVELDDGTKLFERSPLEVSSGTFPTAEELSALLNSMGQQCDLDQDAAEARSGDK